MDLLRKRCVPCEGGMPPMKLADAKRYLKQTGGWKLQGSKIIRRDLKFKDFSEAMKFVGKVAGLAEKEGHHPDIYVHSWNQVRLTLSTHAIKGLSENDFILAAKINRLI
ncbi:MAG: 4a-hydroxytetrahydrobiopterin dehydratase [Candidatus Micrarchaeota archaeon]|nr:4a-hydroxytetrahydrobiopterin dehydratase [Candidatus Micrarchaeota archaeon]